LRQGIRLSPEECGIIGFGQRLPGDPKRGDLVKIMRRIEGPVIFHNLRPLRGQPFISTEKLRRYWGNDLLHIRKSGTELTENELQALIGCCDSVLRISLARLCSEQVLDRYNPICL
jgi:hypothetical protein